MLSTLGDAIFMDLHWSHGQPIFIASGNASLSWFSIPYVAGPDWFLWKTSRVRNFLVDLEEAPIFLELLSDPRIAWTIPRPRNEIEPRQEMRR